MNKGTLQKCYQCAYSEGNHTGYLYCKEFKDECIKVYEDCNIHNFEPGADIPEDLKEREEYQTIKMINMLKDEGIEAIVTEIKFNKDSI